MEPGHVIYETSPLSATRRWKLPKGRTWKNSHTFPDFYFEQFSFFFCLDTVVSLNRKWPPFVRPLLLRGHTRGGSHCSSLKLIYLLTLHPAIRAPFSLSIHLKFIATFFIWFYRPTISLCFIQCTFFEFKFYLKKVAIYCVRWNSMWRLHA